MGIVFMYFLELMGVSCLLHPNEKKSIYPYDYSTVRQDALDVGLEVSKVEAMDKAAGHPKRLNCRV